MQYTNNRRNKTNFEEIKNLPAGTKLIAKKGFPFGETIDSGKLLEDISVTITDSRSPSGYPYVQAASGQLAMVGKDEAEFFELDVPKVTVKTLPEILTVLANEGYTFHGFCEVWSFRKEGKNSFVDNMVRYCGMERPTGWKWEPEWLNYPDPVITVTADGEKFNPSFKTMEILLNEVKETK